MRHAVVSISSLLLASSILVASTAGAGADRNDRKPDVAAQRGALAVTAWWVVFNDAAACADGPAPDGGTCLIIPVLDPPLVGDLFASNGCVIHGSGTVVDQKGRARLVASLFLNDLTDDETNPCVLGDAGLLDPMTAEVHLVVRNHGKALQNRDRFLEQITSFNGGCAGGPVDGPNDCADLQAAFHAACTPGDATCDPVRSDRDVLWLPEPFLEFAGLSPKRASQLALERAGTSTLYRSPQGLTMVIETSLKDLLRRRGHGGSGRR